MEWNFKKVKVSKEAIKIAEEIIEKTNIKAIKRAHNGIFVVNPRHYNISKNVLMSAFYELGHGIYPGGFYPGEYGFESLNGDEFAVKIYA